MTAPKPAVRPHVAHFSSGPCAKRPGYSLENLKGADLGRSHRSKPGKAKLKLAIDETRAVLGVPDDYLIGIVAASDTGAFEMAMWSMLGARGVDVLVWEAFSKDWATDVTKQLKIPGARVLEAAYGTLPDLSKVDFKNDVIFAWNGTTSGVRVPDADWIPADREGLTLLRCDLGRLCARPRLEEARRHHLLLAEGARRRGAARNTHPFAPRGGPSRKLYAVLAHAEDLPHDQGRQAQPRNLRRIDHQHAVHALRGGLCRRASLGEGSRRMEGVEGALRREFQGHRRLGGAHALGWISSRPIRRRGRTRPFA